MTNVTNIDEENGDVDDSQQHPSSSSSSTTTTDVASLSIDTRDVSCASSSERVVKETSVDGIVLSEVPPSVACLPTSHCLKGDDDEDDDDDEEEVEEEEEDDGTIFVRYLDSDEDF